MSQTPLPLPLLLGLSTLLGPACVWIGDDEWDDRVDQDGDGVPIPDDCDDHDPKAACEDDTATPGVRWEAVVALDTAANATLTADEGSHLGYDVARVGDVDGDGRAELLVGAPGADDGITGAAHVLTLSEDDSTEPGLYATIDGEGYLGHRAAVSGAGYVDGDEYLDVLVGFPDHGDDYDGAVYLCLGPDFSSDQVLVDDLDESDSLDGYLGTALSTAGDLNGDGHDDLILGAAHYDSSASGSGSGAAWIVLGARDVSDLGASQTIIGGERAYDGYVGYAVADAGDADGDGTGDLIISDFDATCEGRTGAGGMHMGLAANLPLDDSIMNADDVGPIFCGEEDNEKAGFAVSGAGDLDGDGLDESLVGAPCSSEEVSFGGAAYIVQCSGTGLGCTSLVTLAVLHGAEADGQLGFSVSGAGDLDADDYDDIVLGGPDISPGTVDSPCAPVGDAAPGAIYVLYGSNSFSGPVEPDATLTGPEDGDAVGYAVAGPGDTDGDGFDDLLIGAPWAGEGVGRVYLLLHPPET